MTIRNIALPALSLALMAGLAVFSMSPVSAAEKAAKDPVISAAGKTASSDALLMRLSNEGYGAMRAIKAARLAIFNDKPDLATTMVESAAEYLKVAAKDDTKYIVKTNKATSGSAVVKFIPIDGALFIVDNFKMTPQKKDKIAKANEHLKKGNSKKAIEVLRLASIDVAMQRVIMPVGTTLEHVKAAANLLDNDKLYEANLELKAAEDGLVVDTVVLEGPAAGNTKKSK